MGQFSWLDCKTGKQIVADTHRDVFVLIPQEFGGGHLVEPWYDGYGHFAGEDIFELVADWNRAWIAEEDFIFPSTIDYYKFLMDMRKKNPRYDYSRNMEFKASEKDWWTAYSDITLDKQGVQYVTGAPYRNIGIDIASADKDNEMLLYPIKITYDEDAVYEECPASKGDPNQGWEE